jgi:hypothetical protein
MRKFRAMVKPTFRVLRQALLDLGFEEVPQDRPRYRFDHPPSGTFFVLRKFTDDELVDVPNLVAISGLLELRGVIDESAFEEMLRERSLAS